MVKIEEVREWVSDMLAEGADRLELRAKHDDARVRQWPLAANDTTDKGRAERLAQQIVREATRDGSCQNVATVVYAAFAFRGESDGYLARMPLEVEGRPRKSGASGSCMDTPIESASLQGVVTMLMKEHGELHRLLIMSQEGRAEADSRTIDRLREQLNQHEMKRAVMLEMYEKLQSMQMEREQQRQDMKVAEERQKDLGKKIDMILPVVVNRVLGGGPGKGTPYLGEEMIRQIMGNLTEAEFSGFMRMASFRPELQILFVELYKAYYNEEQARKDAEAAAAGQNGAAKPGKEEPS
jgi:hypothetical protein